MDLLSASGIKAWKECQRLWAFTYIQGRRSEGTGATNLGSEVHAQLERYIRDGTPFDFTKRSGELAAALKPYVPEPRDPDSWVEKYFKIELPDGGYRGFIDVSIGPNSAWGAHPTVIDHKTCGSFDYALNEKTLPEDIAAVLYAQDTFITWPDAEKVSLEWNYVKTKGAPTVRPVHVIVNRKETQERFEKIHLDAKPIRRHLQLATDPLSLPPSPSRCDKYGGCPFRRDCNLSPFDVLETMSNTKMDMDFLNKLGSADFLSDILGKPVSDEEKKEAAALYAINPPESSEPVSVPEPQPVPEPVEKPKRGRTKKEVPASVAEGYDLFINCAPQGYPSTLADDLIKQANQEVSARAGTEDYRLPPLDYGKGAALLSARVLELAQGKTHIVLNDKTPEGSAVASVLQSNARSVVRGF